MHDVISAFLDNEPFDPQELTAALATSEGRDQLIDLIALRSVVQPDQSIAALSSRRRNRMWLLPAAATVMLAGGYGLGQWSAKADSVALGSSTEVIAPAPTTVIKFEPGVNWSEATAQPQRRD